MIPRALRFRRFSHRLLVLFVGLLFLALATIYYFVSRTNDANVRARAYADLDRAARAVNSVVKQRIEFLANSAKVMTGDYAFKQAFSDGDSRTLSSALVSYTSRVGAPVITLYDPEGKLLANSDPGMDNENTGPFRFLISEATEKDLTQHT